MTPTPDEPYDEPLFPSPQQPPLDFLDLPAPEPPSDGKAQPEPSAGPEFILRLGPAEYALEMPLLRRWVDDLLIPTYLNDRPPSSTALWCPSWWEHQEAEARLHALWLEFQYHTDPEAGGFTGPGTWHDRLDITMRELRAPHGPFARCTHNPDRPVHRDAKPVAWHLPEAGEHDLPATTVQPSHAVT